jgi:hypothetical protein
MARYFNEKHTPIKIGDQVMLKLATDTEIGYCFPNMSTLDVKNIGPFKVKNRVGKVAIELDLLEHLRIHLVISCIHLEPFSNELRTSAPPPPPVVIEGEERFIIDRILERDRADSQARRRKFPTTALDGKAIMQTKTLGSKRPNCALRPPSCGRIRSPQDTVTSILVTTTNFPIIINR